MRRCTYLIGLTAASLLAAAAPEAPGQTAAQQQQKQAKKRGGGVLSSSIRVGDVLYVSGAGSSDPKTGKHPEGMENATRQVMANLKRYLGEHGFTFEDAVVSQVWITDMSKFAQMNKSYREVFTEILPTRTTVAVNALPGGSTVEIALVATKAEKKVVRPKGAKGANLPFSPGILVGDRLYVSGQAGFDPATGKLIEGDVKAHVVQTLKNVEAVLQAADMDFSNVVVTHVFLTNPADYAGMNEAYRSFFKGPLPARVAVGAPKLPGNAPVEITVFADRRKGKPVLPEGMKPSPNYSRGLVVGNELFVSGVASSKETTQEAVDDCLSRAEQVVKAAGFTMADVTEARVYLADGKEFGAMNKAYTRYFTGGKPPSRATVFVEKLPLDRKIMIALVAAKAEK